MKGAPNPRWKIHRPTGDVITFGEMGDLPGDLVVGELIQLLVDGVATWNMIVDKHRHLNGDAWVILPTVVPVDDALMNDLDQLRQFRLEMLRMYGWIA